MKRALLLLGLLVAAGPVRATEFDEPQAKSLQVEPQAKSPQVTPATGQEAASKLAPAILRGSAQVPELWLAQRSIDREWGLSDDSTYRTVDVQGWKSEGMALLLSGALPGAGQVYVGEGSGWFYMAGEALLWAGRVITRHHGVELRDQAAAFVGDPNDSTATWSFARYATATGGSADQLQQLWAADRESYYQTLATDPSYRSGFAGADPGVAYESYRGMRDDSQDRFRQARNFEILTWVNHAVASFDALRAAHFHNVPLRRTLELQVDGRVHRGEPQFRAALLRRF